MKLVVDGGELTAIIYALRAKVEGFKGETNEDNAAERFFTDGALIKAEALDDVHRARERRRDALARYNDAVHGTPEGFMPWD